MHDGSIHAIGNGQLLIYGEGPDIRHVFGPPYTSADQLSLVVSGQLNWNTERIRGSFIWRHVGFRNGEQAAVLTDVLHPDLPLWVRRVESAPHSEYPIDILWPDFARTAGQPEDGKRLVRIPAASPLFMYRSGRDSYHSVQFERSSFREHKASANRLRLVPPTGTSEIRFVGGPSYPENRRWEEISRGMTFEDVQHASERAASVFFPRICPALPDGFEPGFAAEIRATAEDVAVLIQAQQGSDGGVAAGYPFPLAYVRDQYGVARGLLELGLYPEARRMLEFRFNKWKQYGNLKNAETIGGEAIRHIHENDDVEITAYTMLQAFEFVEKSGEYALLSEWSPMLQWCFESQIPHLAGGMLPFNGDETYVAGQFLPRSALNDGSAEATLLFVEAGRKWLILAEQSGLAAERDLQRYAHILADTEREYENNFVVGDKLIANNPKRKHAMNGLPTFRHGVCMTCPPDSETFFGWTEQVADNLYVCPFCVAEGGFEPVNSREMMIPSVYLLPPFLSSSLVPEALLRSRFLDEWEAWGDVMDGRNTGKRFVGYDMGLFLYGLAHEKHPRTMEFLRFVLNSRDAASSWSERYIGIQHEGCRARPWESAINLTSILYAVNRWPEQACGMDG